MPLTTGYPMAGEQTGSQSTPEDVRDAVADAALDAVGFDDGETPTEHAKSAEKPASKAAAKPDAEPDTDDEPEDGTDAGETEEPDDTDESEDTEEPEDEPTKGAELDKARRALARAKVPKKIIDSLSDEELIAWGKETAQHQATVDKAFTELKELQTRKSETDTSQTDESQTADGKGSDTAAAAKSAETVDLSEAASALRAELGDETADALVKLLQASHKPYLEKIGMLEKSLGLLTKASEANVLSSARAALVERYPTLTDDQFAAVKAKAETLAKTGDYRGKQDDLFADAAKLAIGEPDTSKQREALRDQHRSRSRGTPSTSSRKPTKPRSIEQRKDAALDAALDGKSGQEIAAAWSGGA